MKLIDEKVCAYIAGFLDGDGCLMAQIIKGVYKYKFRIRLSIVFYQHAKRKWFLLQLKKLFDDIGYVRIHKTNNMCDYTITGSRSIEHILLQLMPYIQLKKTSAALMLQLIKKEKLVTTKADFIEVCQLVDKIAEQNFSKKRIITSKVVEATLMLPVETEKSS
uniref:Putative site-specific DNA endonuclease n=1 Tax=Mesostigma viride TaxID=41882 RepID=Q9B440_MESVI|nr:putative site-specific DNA endonuclease [Mesostigma viride]AAK16693.1 putative site-specific DNA endonuclease [Mesostigma viride]